MPAVPFKPLLKELIHSGLRTPRREQALVGAVALLPPALQGVMRKVVPQPSDYRATDKRAAMRHGMSWDLYPAEYFQWHHYFGFADAVLDVLSAVTKAGDRVFDVGANIGLYTAILAKRVGSQGRVSSFEPNPSTFARLSEHVKANGLRNVDCFDYALGEHDGASTLHAFGGGDSGKASLRAAAAEQEANGVTVHVRSIDGVLQREGAHRVDVIKIDVEGFEPEVLLGASRTIQDQLPLLCVEWSPQWHAGRAAKGEAALRLLENAGYQCFAISSEPATHAGLRLVGWSGWRTTQQNLLLLPHRSLDRLETLRLL